MVVGLSPGSVRALLSTSRTIDRLLRWVAIGTGALFLVLMAVTCVDVISRKAGYQIPHLGSTALQELEWHLHTIMFAGWLGYCYVNNAHVRVDAVTAQLSRRTRAWLELLGCLFLALPYCLVMIWYGFDFIERSYLYNEVSDAPEGLPMRWLIKGVLYLGIILLFLGVVSVLARVIVFLAGHNMDEPLPNELAVFEAVND